MNIRMILALLLTCGTVQASDWVPSRTLMRRVTRLSLQNPMFYWLMHEFGAVSHKYSSYAIRWIESPVLGPLE
jgi:hypothetical protein